MPISDYTPNVDDVGALLRDRTIDSGGNEIGTFNSNTRPTGDEVQELIQDAVMDAFTYFGEDIPDAPGDTSRPGYDPDALREAAKRAVAFHAAATVELSHFGEQVARGNSPQQQYEQRWQDSRKRITSAIESAGGDSPSGGDTGSNMPQGQFPQDAGGMVGWGSRW